MADDTPPSGSTPFGSFGSGDNPFANLPMFGDVVATVVAGEVAAGVLPIENVVGGGVREVYDLLLGTEATVIGEVIVPVRLCLAGLPGERLEVALDGIQ